MEPSASLVTGESTVLRDNFLRQFSMCETQIDSYFVLKEQSEQQNSDLLLDVETEDVDLVMWLRIMFSWSSGD